MPEAQSLQSDPSDARRFAQEARTVAALHHPAADVHFVDDPVENVTVSSDFNSRLIEAEARNAGRRPLTFRKSDFLEASRVTMKVIGAEPAPQNITSAILQSHTTDLIRNARRRQPVVR